MARGTHLEPGPTDAAPWPPSRPVLPQILPAPAVAPSFAAAVDGGRVKGPGTEAEAEGAARELGGVEDVREVFRIQGHLQRQRLRQPFKERARAQTRVGDFIAGSLGWGLFD